jgi:dTDP-glucose 4,6-dehydratase
MRAAFDGFRPDIVMHLAAETHVDRSIDGPRAFLDANVVGTFVLLEAALAYWRGLEASAADRFRFHHVSTDEVFGALDGDDPASCEDDAYRPNSPYAATKAAGDHLVRAWHRTYGLPAVLSSGCNTYGPYQFPEKLIPLMVVNGLAGLPLPVYGDGGQTREWLHVDDHARALIAVAGHGRPGRRYNIGGGEARTNRAVVEAIADALDRLVPDPATGPRRSLIRLVPDRPGHDRRYALDCRRIADELGWRPAESFEAGLAATVRWYAENRAWWQPIRDAVYRGERLGAPA